MKVFSTSRALRNFHTAALFQNQFIDKAITLGELFNKMVLVPERTFADYETRLLLLAKSSEFDNFDKLHIQRDLFSFLHNSQYIFRFFEELSGEGVDITSIDAADTYVEYEEHLAILIQLRKNYQKLLEEKMLTDSIFLPEHAELNIAYIKGVETLEIDLEGYFTNYELKLLEEASKHIPIRLKIYANEYNEKMLSRFKMFGFELSTGFIYVLHLSDKSIESQEPYESVSNISVSSFSERILQVAFIKQQVSVMIREDNIAPENIVIILPTEGFAQILALYDDEKMFNFAMGLPFTESLFILRINAATTYFDHPMQEQLHRKNRYVEGVESAYELLRIHYSEVVSMALFEKIIETFCVGLDENSLEIISKELFSFSKLSKLLEGNTLKTMLQLFMQRLSTASLDDVRGGKITVMGLLETRGTSFEGVVVVDFNDEFIPKKSQKDLFLSSSIKSIVGLPTPKDRESLQKYFYQRLFEQARCVAISYVSSDTQMPSRFLTELGISKSKQAEDEAGFATILYQNSEKHSLDLRELVAEYDFTKQPLSATGLKTFLECKRKFYHSYIGRLKGHELPQDMPKESEIGSWLHKLLEIVYSKHKSFKDVEVLKKEVEDAFSEHKQKGEMGRYLVRLWLEKLNPFYESEIEHFRENYEVYACEKSLQTIHKGIPITGIIDRLDTRDGMLQVIDYKSGKIPLISTEKQLEKATEFQLEFYALLASSLGEVSDAYYYDLKEGRMIKEVLLTEKLAKLDDIFDYLVENKKFNFEMTEDKAVCKYCDYVYLCGKEI